MKRLLYHVETVLCFALAPIIGLAAWRLAQSWIGSSDFQHWYLAVGAWACLGSSLSFWMRGIKRLDGSDRLRQTD